MENESLEKIILWRVSYCYGKRENGIWQKKKKSIMSNTQETNERKHRVLIHSLIAQFILGALGCI
jgi:hypothetical protein